MLAWHRYAWDRGGRASGRWQGLGLMVGGTVHVLHLGRLAPLDLVQLLNNLPCSSIQPHFCLPQHPSPPGVLYNNHVPLVCYLESPLGSLPVDLCFVLTFCTSEVQAAFECPFALTDCTV